MSSTQVDRRYPLITFTDGLSRVHCHYDCREYNYETKAWDSDTIDVRIDCGQSPEALTISRKAENVDDWKVIAVFPNIRALLRKVTLHNQIVHQGYKLTKMEQVDKNIALCSGKLVHLH